MKPNEKEPELPVESSMHVEKCNGEQFLALCARAKRGEIRIFGVESGTHFGVSRPWIWKATYEIIKTPATEAAGPTLPREVKATQIDLLTVEPRARQPFYD